MIGSTLIERKAAALFLFSSIETGLFQVERALPTPGQHHLKTNVIKQIDCPVSARRWRLSTIAFRWMKIEKVVFIHTNRSFDLSDPIKLATFRVFICSKMEHKINKIRINLYTSGKLRF